MSDQKSERRQTSDILRASITVMDDAAGTLERREDFYTLLCVRADGVASFVDVYAADDLDRVRSHAEALLREHLSSRKIEVWRDGALVEELDRA